MGESKRRREGAAGRPPAPSEGASGAVDGAPLPILDAASRTPPEGIAAPSSSWRPWGSSFAARLQTRACARIESVRSGLRAWFVPVRPIAVCLLAAAAVPTLIGTALAAVFISKGSGPEGFAGGSAAPVLLSAPFLLLAAFCWAAAAAGAMSRAAASHPQDPRPAALRALKSAPVLPKGLLRLFFCSLFAAASASAAGVLAAAAAAAPRTEETSKIVAMFSSQPPAAGLLAGFAVLVVLSILLLPWLAAAQAGVSCRPWTPWLQGVRKAFSAANSGVLWTLASFAPTLASAQAGSPSPGMGPWWGGVLSVLVVWGLAASCLASGLILLSSAAPKDAPSPLPSPSRLAAASALASFLPALPGLFAKAAASVFG